MTQQTKYDAIKQILRNPSMSDKEVLAALRAYIEQNDNIIETKHDVVKENINRRKR